MKKYSVSVSLALLALVPVVVSAAAMFSIPASIQTLVATKMKNGVVSAKKVDAVPVGFVEYRDSKRKFSFIYPDSWTKVVAMNTDQDVLLEFKTRHSGVDIVAQTVVRVTKTDSYTQQSYNDYIKTVLASYGPKKDGEQYSLTSENFAGAKNVMHLQSSNSKESPAYADTYALVKNGYIYVLSYQSTDNDYALDLPLLKRVVASFKVN